MNIDRYLKALVGAGLAGLTAAGTALADGHVTGYEWVGIATAALATLGGVYAVPNAAVRPVATPTPNVEA